MNQSFFTGAVAAQQQMYRMNVQGNNIANLNTYGYKADKARFTTLMYQNMLGIEDDAVPYGLGARMMMTSTDFAQGAPADTGRSQDYMIEGDGFFALANLATGEISFTRNGAFSWAQRVEATGELDEEGVPIMEVVYYLSDGDGRFVLNTQGGMIRMGEDQDEAQNVGVFDYINYDGMTHLDDTRFLPVDKNGGLRLGDGKVIHKVLEMSNADLAEEMTKVIESQRAYGLALKIVQTSDEIETTINDLSN